MHAIRTSFIPFESFDRANTEVLCDAGDHIVTGEITSAAHIVVTPDQKRRAKTEFARAYRYAVELLASNPFAHDSWNLEFVSSGGFGSGGSLIEIPQDQIASIDQSEAKTEYIRSQFVHELMHFFRETEDIPMFAEILYLVEHQQHERLEEIQTMYNELEEYPGFTQNYIWGYEQIAKALNIDPHELLDTLKHKPLIELKGAFRRYTQRILRAEGLIE